MIYVIVKKFKTHTFDEHENLASLTKPLARFEVKQHRLVPNNEMFLTCSSIKNTPNYQHDYLRVD